MWDLIRFELKKIVGNKAGMLACGLALLIIVGITVLDVFTTQVYDKSGRTCSGLDALNAYRVRQTSHEGILDAERVAADLVTYDHAKALSESEEPAYSEMDGEQILDSYGLEFWRETYAVLNDTYYKRLHSTMLIDDEQYASDLQQGASKSLETTLGEGLLGHHAYSLAEKNLWLDMASRIEWPLEYGYADGWVTAFSWMSFTALSIASLCVALSGVFCTEYQTRADSIVLATKRGKRELPVAKAVASLIFSTAYWLITVIVMLASIFIFFGADGADLPLQMTGFANPYPLTMAGATMLRIVLGYVVALGMAGITLLVSSKAGSSLGAAAIPVAVIFFGLLGLFFGPLTKVATLTPASLLSWSYSVEVSYAAGSVAVDLPTAAAILYAVVLITSVPLAMRSFSRHQVS